MVVHADCSLTNMGVLAKGLVVSRDAEECCCTRVL